MASARPRATREEVLLRLPTRPGLKVSERAFYALCRANPEMRLERTAEGELIAMAPAGMDSGRRNISLSGQLWLWNERTGLGVAFDSSAGFTLPNTAIRSPDACWLSLDRWEAIPEEDRKRFSHVYPDFVAELRSESDSKPTLRRKMQEYLSQGVRLGWLIDPHAGEVEIDRPGREVEIPSSPATLSGEDVLPGFVLDLAGIL